MNRNVIYTRILLVVLAVAFLIAFTNRSPHRTWHDSWLPSSLNPVGAGHLAFYQTLSEAGWPVERWRDPLSRLPNQPGNLLIITRSANGRRVSFSDQESITLEKWVRQGNTLFLLGALGNWDDTRNLLRYYGYNIPEPLYPDKMQDFLPKLNAHPKPPLTLSFHSAAGQAGNLIIPNCDPLPFGLSAKAEILAQQDTVPYFVEIPHGAGRVLYSASDQLLSNRWLLQGDNLTLVLGLLAPHGQAPHQLYFEESHHGFTAVYALSNLLEQPGLRFAGVLVLLGTLVYLGSSFVRFGEIIPLQADSGRSVLEFIDSMADLYARAKLRNDIVRYLFQRTHEQVLYRLNLPRHASHELIAQRLQQLHPELPKWKKLAQRFDSNDYVQGLPPTGWLRVARDLIQIKSALL